MNKATLKSAALVLVAMAAAFGITNASAKQCVANKGAFVLEVAWYEPDDIGVANLAMRGDGLVGRDRPRQVDTIPIGQQSCNRASHPMTAVALMPAAMVIQITPPVLAGTRFFGRKEACRSDSDCIYQIVKLDSKGDPRLGPLPLSSDPFKIVVLLAPRPTTSRSSSTGRRSTTNGATGPRSASTQRKGKRPRSMPRPLHLVRST